MSLQYNVIFSKVQIQLIMLHGRTEEFSSDMLTAATGAVKATQISRVQFNDSCCTKNLMKIIFFLKRSYILIKLLVIHVQLDCSSSYSVSPSKGFTRYKI